MLDVVIHWCLSVIALLQGRMQDALQHYKGMLEEDANDFRPYICQVLVDKEMILSSFFVV